MDIPTIGADNMIEIKKIVNCLVRNGYEFDGTREAVYDGTYYDNDDAIADFSKKLEYTDVFGDYKNDSIVKVSIHFEKRADYKNLKANEHQDIIYDGDTTAFIMNLVEEIQESSKDSSSRGTIKNRKTYLK
jgi:hypothetical protein